MAKNTAIDSKIAGKQNEMRLLAQLREHGPLQQSQICKLTGMGFSTASTILARLREKQLIIEQQGTSEKRGAKPTNISINPQARYLVGIEISPTSLLMGIFDFNSQIVDTLNVAIKTSFTVEKIVEILEINLLGFLSRHQVPKEKVLGIAVTISGSVSPGGIVELSSPMGWRNVELKKMLAEKIDLNIQVYPTRVRFLAELAIEKQLVSQNVLYLNATNGVGGTVYYNGSLMYGSTGRCGELGHIVVEKDGPLCGCGNKGCLEVLVSGPAIAAKLRDILKQTTDAELSENLTDSMIAQDVLKLLSQAVENNNSIAMAIQKDVSEKIASVVAMAINFYDPEVIVLAGYVCTSFNDYLKKAVKAAIYNQVYDSNARQIGILDASAGENTLISGAAVALLQDIDFVE